MLVRTTTVHTELQNVKIKEVSSLQVNFFTSLNKKFLKTIWPDVTSIEASCNVFDEAKVQTFQKLIVFMSFAHVFASLLEMK